ncbi:uncharacterized protein LOC114357764 [Ostrinia furnacalis]|uniref:uncharacterized protein LOC114357764 n=1 Tax=Ostrinia furnacalis TaxID=93504 RepID=UPI00103EA3A8|nr:uncharacterized protein LOC114357764 [Ostrinia furnacalis]
MDEALIKWIKHHSYIWDTKHPLYKQLDVKEEAWKDVVRKTKMESVSVAKSRWLGLRSAHRRAIISFNNNKRKGTPNVRVWKYLSQMKFLVPHMCDVYRDVTPPPDFSPGPENTATDDSTNPNTTPVSKRLKYDDENSVDTEKTNVQSNENTKEDTLNNPLKYFFDAMYESTKQMPESYQKEIKRKLFHSVMEAEDAITNNNTATNND